MEPQRKTDSRLRGRRLLIARVAWLAWAFLIAGLFVENIPANFESYRALCSQAPCENQLTPEQARAFQALGLSVDFLAAYSIALDVVFAAVHLVIALVIFARRSDDWLALFVAFTLVTFAMVTFTGSLDPLAAGDPAWWLPVQFMSLIGSVSIVVFLYIFPNGKFVPRWTRWLATLWAVEEAARYFFPDSAFSRRTWPPLPAALVFVGFVGAGIFAQVYRYRRVSGLAQRQQTKWVVFGVMAGLGGYIGAPLPVLIIPPLEQNPFFLLVALTAQIVFLLLIPLSLGLAILRSRLWDIDIIIRRTLVYSVLTALLALVYFGSVVILQSAFAAVGGRQLPVTTVLSTLAIAAISVPLRRRVQDVIDRRFYRRKYDAAKVLAEFAATVRDETDLDRLTERLVAVVKETMQPAHVSLWLKPTADRGWSTAAAQRARGVGGRQHAEE